TYADMSAVNPNVMTPWRSEQLWQLYLIVHAELTRELQSDRVAEPPDEFLQGFPTRYLLTHTREEIEDHLALEEESRKKNGIAVELKRLDAVWEVTLCAPDRPGLFASAAGSLSTLRLKHLRA